MKTFPLIFEQFRPTINMRRLALVAVPLAFLTWGCHTSSVSARDVQDVPVIQRYKMPKDAKNIQELGNNWVRFTLTTAGKEREFLYNPGNGYGGKVLMELE